jgi:hypothetical protein
MFGAIWFYTALHISAVQERTAFPTRKPAKFMESNNAKAGTSALGQFINTKGTAIALGYLL